MSKLFYFLILLVGIFAIQISNMMKEYENFYTCSIALFVEQSNLFIPCLIGGVLVLILIQKIIYFVFNALREFEIEVF